MVVYPALNFEFKIGLNSLAIQIYKMYNKKSNPKFDAQSLISSKFLENRMIDVKKYSEMMKDGMRLIVNINSSGSGKKSKIHDGKINNKHESN